MKRTTLIIVLVLCLATPGLSGCFLFDSGGTDDTESTTPTNQGAQGDAQDDDDGMARVSVPNVVNMDVSRAIDKLAAEGLKPAVRWRRSPDKRRLVLSQSSDGEMVAPGSFVQLVVSLGETPTVPPPPFLAAARLEADLAAQAAASGGGEADGGSSGGTSGGTTPAPASEPDPVPAPEDNPNDIPGVVASSPVEGTLSVGDSDDVYRIIMDAGDSIVISCALGTSTTDPEFQLMLFAPTAKDIGDAPTASALTGDYPRNLNYQATTSGTFYILVHHAGLSSGSGGDYTLSWSKT